MRKSPVALVAVLTFAVAASALSAQAAKREGLYASVGAGWGSLLDSCSSDFTGGCNTDSGGSSTTGYLALGAALDHEWRLGAEVDGWEKDQAGGSTQSTRFYSLVATYYPSRNGNFYFKGAPSYVSNTQTINSASTTLRGFGFELGFGYDWMPGDGDFAVIPFVNFLYQFSGGGVSAPASASIKARLFQLGVGVGYRH